MAASHNSKNPGCISILIAIVIILGLYVITGLILNGVANFLSSFSSLGLIILGVIGVVVIIKVFDNS
jgi:hypothetical protein